MNAMRSPSVWRRAACVLALSACGGSSAPPPPTVVALASKAEKLEPPTAPGRRTSEVEAELTPPKRMVYEGDGAVLWAREGHSLLFVRDGDNARFLARRPQRVF